MKSNFEIEFELVEWMKKAQWCKFYPNEVVIPDNEQFAVEIRVPCMLSGSSMEELANYLKAKDLCWLIGAGKGTELIIDIWQEPEDMIF